MSTISIGDERATTSDALIQLHPDDSVAICRRALREGERLTPDFSARQDIPAAHKIAIRSLQEGEPVRKYGQVIGYASRPIVPGDHVHEHNLSIGEVDKDYAFCIDRKPTHFISPAATFNGIVRDDGRIATRNYIGILSTVNCSAHVAEVAARFFEKNPLTGEDPLAAFPNVDGVVALTHKTGCGMSSGEPLQILRRVMAGYATHPNFFRVIVVGLGCEVNQVSTFLDRTGLQDRVVSLSIQSIGGSQKAIEHIVGRIRECLPLANQVKREPVPASALSVALICGGSDGYSGITANPALGAASDLLVRHGGTVILSETPETYGAEHLLTRRAEDEAIGRKLVERMAWWTQYAERENVSLNANPTPGNKAGGITTILEKSLGAMTKSGSTNLREVIEYAQPVTQKGFVFMDAPGFDPVQVTGQIASGANLVAFTTGRGSVFGAKPAPSIKLATNTKMFRHMQDDMDINCGTIVDGTETLEQCGQRIFDLLLHVASGEKSKSEQMDFGKSEFAPWIQGACI